MSGAIVGASVGLAGSAGSAVEANIAIEAASPVASETSALVAEEAASDALPTRLARAIPGEGPFTTLGRAGEPDVFVTVPEDIRGLNARELAERLTRSPNDVFTIIEFSTPDQGLASPVNRPNAGFVPGGKTKGGAREFIISNGPIPKDAVVKIIR